jgi:hypothetical protein
MGMNYYGGGMYLVSLIWPWLELVRHIPLEDLCVGVR